jgi:hypothetical protein
MVGPPSHRNRDACHAIPADATKPADISRCNGGGSFHQSFIHMVNPSTVPYRTAPHRTVPSLNKERNKAQRRSQTDKGSFVGRWSAARKGTERPNTVAPSKTSHHYAMYSGTSPPCSTSLPFSPSSLSGSLFDNTPCHAIKADFSESHACCTFLRLSIADQGTKTCDP